MTHFIRKTYLAIALLSITSIASTATATPFNPIDYVYNAVANALNSPVSDVAAVEDMSIPLKVQSSLADLDASEILSVMISDIPVGATLSDGANIFTASVGSTSVDILTWNFATLKITPSSCGDFALKVEATSVKECVESSVKSTTFFMVNIPLNGPSSTITHDTAYENTLVPVNVESAFVSANSSETEEIAMSDLPVEIICSESACTDVVAEIPALTPEEKAPISLSDESPSDELEEIAAAAPIEITKDVALASAVSVDITPEPTIDTDSIIAATSRSTKHINSARFHNFKVPAAGNTSDMSQLNKEVNVNNDCNRAPVCETREDCCYCQPVCCGRGFLKADVLYLRAFEGGLSCVCEGTEIIDGTENGVIVSRLNGRGVDPNFKWNLGFGIGAGYEFPNSNCDLEAYWTHYNSHSSNDSRVNNHHWKINFNVVDVLYSCTCDWSPCFSLTPFGGLRFASIDQKLSTHFISIENGVTTTTRGSSKEDFFGIGPVIGVEGEWRMRCGFSLYGDIDVGFLYGTFHVKSNQTDVFSTGTNINHLKKHIQAVQAVVDAGLGIRWRTCFCRNKVLTLQLGLEQHRYFNQNRFGDYGDLSLDGVSFGFGIDY